MRYSQSEKMEVIKLVEESALSVRRTLRELEINRSTFYAWYRRYAEDGYDGLTDRKPSPHCSDGVQYIFNTKNYKTALMLCMLINLTVK